MNDNIKILKGLLLTIIIVPIIIILLWYIWLLYEGSKLDNYTFTEDMKLELMDTLGIKESQTFNPISLHFTNPFGSEYYNYYELKFIISKDDYEKNNLTYGTGEDLETLTYGLQRESKDESTYICTAKVTKDFHEEMFYGFKKVYNEMRGIKSEDSISTDTFQESTTSNIAENTQTTEEIVNAPSISEDWWKEYDLAIDNLDTKYFVTDFETYKSSDKSKNLTNKQISEIAEKGFEESAKRIAGEGASNKETEEIKLEEIIPNNYFTRKYREGDTNYPELKMNAYVVSRENEMGCGIKIYIDPSTGLIVGGMAYGD